MNRHLRSPLATSFGGALDLTEDLKLKDFYTSRALSNADVLAPDFPARLAEACREAGPLVAFLCKALALPY